MKKAWVENGIIRDICNGNPDENYHPDIAVFYSADIPEYCINGAQLLDGVWTNPVIPDPVIPPVALPVINPLQFKLCFTMQERVAIKNARATDELLQVAFEVLDDPRLEVVDLAKPCTIEMIDYLVTINCITAERAIDVKLGKQI